MNLIPGSTELSILIPAFLVGVLTILTHIPLGLEVFKKGIVFIDIAIAQFAAFGIVFANSLFPELIEQHVFITQLSAFLFALLAALIFTFTDKKFPDLQEAIIGSAFIFAASISMILLSNNPHGAEHFQDILAGQILWSSYQDVMRLLIFYLPILLIWFKWQNKIGRTGFYLLFALVITNSVQIIGVYLVFSFLILPSFVAINFQKYREKIFSAYLTAVIALVIGLLASNNFDYPTGPVIAVSLAVVSLIGSLVIWWFSPKGKNHNFK